MLTRSWRRALLVVALTLVALVASASWYLVQNSMSVAREFEVNDPRASNRVLIATQGSAFKDAVVAGVVARLEGRGAYVKVIDIASLGTVREQEWSAIAIVHTWEMGQAPAEVRRFAATLREPHKLVGFATSGRGDFKLDGVDVISSASRMPEVPARVADLAGAIDAILGTTPPGTGESP
jgi:hypothetical protein